MTSSKIFAISKHCNSLSEVREKFSAIQATDDSFFTEWFADLPALTESEKERCDRVKERYLYHRDNGHIGEGLVNQIVIAPLLEMVKFYDPPFRVEAEYPVQIEAEQDEEIYRGRIDTLVIHQTLWVLAIESKGTSFNIEEGMAQALTYMLTSPNKAHPTYGFICNGSSSIFAKVFAGVQAEYAFSDDFSLYRRRKNELHDVLSILKTIAQQCLKGIRS
jgi:hypothetical protein